MDLTPSSVLLPAGIALLIGWRMFARIRRMVGRQRLSRARPWFTVILFPLLILLLLAGSIVHPGNAAALAAGVALGVALGVLGLRLTRFEATPLGLFYTPSAHLGIALSLLLVLRIGYRAAKLYLVGGGLRGDPSANLMSSPLTLAIFGTLAGYYVAYAVGLLRWRARTERRSDAPERSAASPPTGNDE